MEIIVFSMIVGCVFFGLFFYVSTIFKNRSNEMRMEEPEEDTTAAVEEPKAKKKQETKEKKAKETKTTFNHKWLYTSLKGHSKRVLDMDFSSNGKNLATTSEDNTVIIWPTKEFHSREHRNFRCNVQYDHSLFVKWSPDCKAFVLQKAVQNCIEVYKMNKKPEGGFEFGIAVTFPSAHTTDIIGLGMSATGRFIATCSDKTDLIIWSLKGDILARIDTYHNLTYCAKVSPCGRFVATSGFTSDVKVWEVKFSRTGEFEKVVRAFELPGHMSGVYNFSFNQSSSRMVTISKDGTWKVYDTNIEYNQGQDPTIIQSQKFPGNPNKPSITAISPDGKLVCIAQDKCIRFYSVATGECEGEIDNVHTEPITCVLFESAGKFVLTAGDRHVRVFHNVPGLKANIKDLEGVLERNMSNSAAKERIVMQIEEARQLLAQVESAGN